MILIIPKRADQHCRSTSMVFSRMNDRIKSAKEIIHGTREISEDIFELQTQNAKLQQERDELRANIELIADICTRDGNSEIFRIAARTKGSLDELKLEQQDIALTFALENISKPENIFCKRKKLRQQASELNK